MDTEAYELRERDRKRAKKAIKDAREWLKDPTPLWARLIIMLLVFKLAQARQSNAMHLHGLYLERRAKRAK